MNATDYLMFNVVSIGNNLSFVSSRFNMCNKFISISSAINIESVRPSTSTHFFILAHCVFEFDTRALKVALKQQNAELSYMDAFPVNIRLMKTVLCSLRQNVEFTVDLSLLLIISDDAVS